MKHRVVIGLDRGRPAELPERQEQAAEQRPRVEALQRPQCDAQARAMIDDAAYVMVSSERILHAGRIDAP
jgi:hypothetical protein